jgi:hypothetical protein
MIQEGFQESSLKFCINLLIFAYLCQSLFMIFFDKNGTLKYEQFEPFIDLYIRGLWRKNRRGGTGGDPFQAQRRILHGKKHSISRKKPPAGGL